MEDNNILEVKKIRKEYKNQVVLDNVNFSIRKGEIIGLVGPNGAGKTTIMSIIVGLINNYEGNVLIDGQDIKMNKKVYKKQVGCVIEAPGLYPNLTGYENLMYFSEVFGGISKEEVDEIVKLLGLKDYVHKKTKKYSLGMKQRLGIAQAVLGYPKLLILDEPTNGLDPNVIPHIRQFIKYVTEEKNISVLISSHILTEIEAICDRVLFIKNGKIIEEVNMHESIDANNEAFIFETDKTGELVEFFSSKSIDAVIIDERKVHVKITDKQAESFLPQLIQVGIVVKGMYKQKVSLEEKFIKSMGENVIE
ncbi:ABC transporter ATP-binding protein [Clostridium saccharobutylicum]|uniref:ABC transporter ATP-binding protein YhcH n=1 Tax=Clostridium saccharobutylicum DSM 13864 TaxID=1345695 RepID=U5MXY4_CLOSA|nr:ABC transporter ATP-binding protein [Clostridium saccharobutylicum]AGX45388.1 ABC transporter ATP-binding protein YhcH [Clostridium saccharobutylicum DSM 13864]AQR92662.1 putative ABC transporter ATP-binding protein YxlF [Clostridium saccharobutylicum]AQS02564.1 putative ABC transporter ATP-binding protein YxlF [Clostridium saccharobutylicum]AQS12169.1 putative ABC transporter ATP-binding protein YxlF [Clostridium saccharobutylicum]AQS16547.1 putative ABC transporter ATP-binding protein Yxl